MWSRFLIVHSRLFIVRLCQCGVDEATWEHEDEMREQFPKLFELEVATRLVLPLFSVSSCFWFVWLLPFRKNSKDKIPISRGGCKTCAFNPIFCVLFGSLIK